MTHFSSRSSFFFLGFLLMTLSAMAQHPAWVHYTVLDGLPSNEVHDAEQADNGYLWFATNRGVVRFDGHSFQTFQEELADQTIHEIFEDENKRLWFIGYSGMLSIWDKGSIQPYRFNDLVKSRLNSKSTLRDFFCFKDSTIYYRLKGESSFKIDAGGTASLLQAKEEPCIHFMAVPGEKGLFSSSSKQRHYCYTLSGFPGLELERNIDRREYAGRTNDGRLFFTVDGVKLYMVSEDSVSLVKRFKADINAVQIQGDKAWVGTTSGVYKFDLAQGGFVESGLLFPDEFVTSVKTDNESGLWVTTVNNGVFYVPNPEVLTVGPAFGLKTRQVVSVHAAANGLIYLGGHRGEIEVVKDGRSIAYHDDYDEKQAIVREFADLPDGRVAFVSTGPCVHTIDSLDRPEQHCDWINFKATLRRISVLGDQIAVGGSGGVNWFHFGDRRFEPLFNRPVLNVISMCFVHDSLLYVGSTPGGFQQKEPREFATAIPRLRDHSGFRIPDMAKLENGVVAMCTDGGGLAFLTPNGELQVSGSEQSRLGRFLTRIDAEGNTLWVGSDRGVERVRVKLIGDSVSCSFEYFNMWDGLGSNAVRDIAVRGSHVWVLTARGVTRLDTTNIPQVSYNPPVYVNEVRVNNERVSHSLPLWLTHEQSRVEVKFSGVSFRNGVRLNYQYRLLGVNDQWNTTSEPGVQFASLTPGSYRFEVRALNKLGEPSVETASFEFNIASPIWRRWWFNLLAAAAVAGIGFLLIYFRLRSIRLKLEKQDGQRRKALEQELRTLRAQLNPHFIFNTLTSIQNHLLKGDTEASQSNLGKLARLMRQVLEHSRSEVVSIAQELQTIRDYLELESSMQATPFTFEIVVQKAVDAEHWVMPSLLIHTYVENAVKHGIRPLTDRKGHLHLELEKDGNWVQCVLDDNGVGRVASASKKHDYPSHGSKISVERIELWNQLQDQHMEVQHHDLQDEEERPAGTRVILRFPILADNR